MDSEMGLLHQKIDALTATIDSQRQTLDAQRQILDQLIQQAEVQRRASEELNELKRDVMPVINHMIKISIDELAEIGTEFQLEDLFFVLKRLLRDTHQIGALLNTLESSFDLLDEVQVVGNQAFHQTVVTLDRLEREGYFAFARSGWGILERIVAEFSEEDVNALGDNIVLILNTIKDMTQPEIMHFVRNTLLLAEKEIEKPVDISFLGLARQMRDPSVRRGLALTMRVLHGVGAQADGSHLPNQRN